MSVSTDAMYNAASRYLHQKLNIHFTEGETPLEVTTSNYLVSSSVLEETHRTSPTPFGDVTSNELSFSIYNEDSIFNPENSASPYYGKIRRGIRIEVFIRPDEVDEWDPQGVFYVTDWSTDSSGITASVTAHDKLHGILNAPVPATKIRQNVPFKDFIVDFFRMFGVQIIVDPQIDFVLPYGFTGGYSDVREFLVDAMIAANADCFCDHHGDVCIVSKTAPRALRATFTDNDQIVSASIRHTLATDYDSAAVTCNALQESKEQDVLSIESVAVLPGITRLEKTRFSRTPVVRVKSLRTEGVIMVKPISFVATSDEVTCSLQSTSEGETKLEIIGTVLETISSVIATEGSSAIEVNSLLVQTVHNATELSEFIDNYVKAELPTLDLVIRGNPRIQLGDKVLVDSGKYRLNYTGIVTQAEYSYAGSLSCKVTLTADTTKEV